jgi:hypothetical protein
MLNLFNLSYEKSFIGRSNWPIFRQLERTGRIALQNVIGANSEEPVCGSAEGERKSEEELKESKREA